jgi:hypothetical protein
MALFQSAGGVPLFIGISSNRAKYGIMASPLSFRISPEIPSVPIDLFFCDRCYPFPNDFRIDGEGFASVGTLYMLNFTLAAEYRSIVVIKRICLFCRIYDGRPLQSLMAAIFSLDPLRLFTYL